MSRNGGNHDLGMIDIVDLFHGAPGTSTNAPAHVGFRIPA